MDKYQILKLMFDLSIFDANTDLLANGTNVEVSIALAAKELKRWHVGIVTVGYSAAPTGGLLTVYEGGNPVFQVPITAAGPTAVAVYRRGAPSNPMSITLSAGGAGIVGYLNVEALSHA